MLQHRPLYEIGANWIFAKTRIYRYIQGLSEARAGSESKIFPSVALGLCTIKRMHESYSMLQLGGRRREHLVRDLHLIRMNQRFTCSSLTE
jgi:hypothetical protein